MKKYYVIFFFFILFMNNLNAQFRLVEEKSEGKIYKIVCETESLNYQIKGNNNSKQIFFAEYLDESNPGSFVIPKGELFVAIPPNTNPNIKFEIIEKEFINALPTVNSKISLDKDGRIISNSEQVWVPIIEQDFINHGIIQIGNNNCLHLTVALYNYDVSSNSMFRNKKFAIEFINIQINQIFQLTSNSDFKVSDVIINKKYAAQNFVQIEKTTVRNLDDWIDYQREYLKIGIANDGIYRIKNNDLIKYGVNVNQIDPHTFQMYLKGKEVPIFVSGEDDNKFDSSDYIEFVGIKNYGEKYREVNAYNTPYNEYLGRYSDTTVVWLTWGKQNGLRVPVHQISSGSASKTINYYNQLTHYEKNVWFDFSTDQLVRRQFPEWTENETWLWNTQGVGSIDLSFSVSNLVLNKPAKAIVKLQSYAADIFKNAHRVGLSINNDSKVYDSLMFDSYKQRVIKAAYNSNLLSNGSNKIKSISFPTSASINSVFHDWYEIEYPRSLILNNDSLQFKFNDYKNSETVNYEINSYQGSPVSIYKYENMLNVSKISNYQIQSSKIVFTDLLDSTKNYFIVPETKILSPKIYYKKQFRNLRSSSNSAEYVIITNPLLMNPANEYSAFINQSYNKKVALINVLDIYDEFNFGFLSAESIKEFLMTIYTNWSGSKLEYVLLLGSANYDYYENRQKQLPAPPHPNLVPSYGAPVSDNWFINWNNSSVYNPIIKIGRIPARTEDDVRNYLSKHKNYLAQTYSELNKRFLFFSGGFGTDQNEMDQLRNGNQYVIDNFVKPAPIGGITHHFYKTLNPNTNFGPFTVSQFQSTIDSSGLFISYLGHSGTQTWDNSITEAKQLHNKVNANPLITDFGCSTAKFAEPDVTSFSELFVTSKDGQAICYIGNSSLGFTSSSLVAPKLFYETILKDSVLNISQALNKTKTKLLTQYGSSDVNKIFSLTNSLIGDPIISLKIPPKPNLEISTNDISFSPAKATNQDDSLKCVVRFMNLGRTINKNFTTSIKDYYNNSLILDKKINRTIPLFTDSLVIFIPVKNKPGEHKISVQLDSEKNIDELNENDNNAEVNLVVTSSSIRALTDYDYTNSLNVIKILNPTTKSSANKIDYQLSTNSSFTNPISLSAQFGELFTKINMSSLQIGNRYWFRSKTSDQSNYDLTRSFVYSSKAGFLLSDSISFTSGTEQNTVIDKSVHLGKETVTIEAISSGFNDGNTGVVTKENQNYIPWPNRGHNVCVFDGNTFTLKLFQTYDLLFGGTSAQDSYAKMLDSLKTTDILVVVIVDEGSINLNSSLKQKLKSFGSKYVDSLGFRDSWALIAKKGTAIGSAAESYAKIFKGRAIAKTSFEKKSTTGYYSTQFIGPSNEWKQFDISYLRPGYSKLSYSLIGKSTSNKVDTLLSNVTSNNIIDLSGQIFKSYQYLKLRLKLEASANYDSPEVNSIFCNYKNVPELGLNYQTVSVNKDTVEQGENVNLTFNVHNAGETTAKNFKIAVEVVRKDNTKEKIFETTIDSIGAEQKKQFSVSYSTVNTTGQIQLNIIEDAENKITELYKDNNIYSFPIIVKPNTKPASLNLTIDGSDIIDGDYISSKPNIRIELNDQSLISIKDTTAVKIYLNNKLVQFLSNSTINYSFSNSNPKFIVDYKPILESGNYTLKVLGKNATGKLIDSSGVVRTFSVRNDLQLLNVYNYPNPFKDETYFTFKLTQIPDELKIKVYTVAGRMIKEFKLSSSELKYDFNRILWDGRDADGDLVANGVYLYKVLTKKGSETSEIIQKLAVVR